MQLCAGGGKGGANRNRGQGVVSSPLVLQLHPRISPAPPALHPQGARPPSPVQGQGARSILPSTSPPLPPGPCLCPHHPGLGSAGEPRGWLRTLLEQLHAGPQIYYKSFLRGNAMKTEGAPERAAAVGDSRLSFRSRNSAVRRIRAQCS